MTYACTMTWEARHISRSIRREPTDVAEFAGRPENLPKWAAGVSSGVRRVGDDWITDSPMGEVRIRFIGPIEHGILDHEVTLPDGTVVVNPMRVLRNDEGSEAVFTLYRLPGVSDRAFDDDAAMIAADLETLRGILEGR